MIDLYHIDGTSNICTYDIEHPCYNSEETWPTFRRDFLNFKKTIIDAVENSKPLSFLRIGDGELGFLNKNVYGNMQSRHISKNIHDVDMDKFWDGVREVDYISTQLYTHQVENFKRDIKFREIDLPLEFIYGVVANKWIFKTFPDSIGLIGGNGKLDLIKKLMEYKEYREYLGVKKFTDYIPVNERFSCDDVDLLEKNIEEKIKDSKAKVFLIGIGISKMSIIHKLKNFKNAVFIDVGCGISALAGTTSLERPYFGSWTNFILDNYDYSSIDRMDYNETAGKNEIILK